MDADAIRGWISRAQEDVSRLADEAERVQGQLAAARRRLMLLYEMLASVTQAPVAIPPEQMGTERPVREQVQTNAEAILREHGKPMRVTDIHTAFVRKCYPLPGRGTPTNIVAHLVASDRFVRHGRGIYGLSVWDRPSHTDETPATGLAVEQTESPASAEFR